MGKRKKKALRTYIREWRKFRGLNQTQLAERVELEQGTISRLENGTIAYTQPVLEAIAEALNCAPADLIMRDPTQPGSLWSIWDQIQPIERDQALRVLETFAKKTGTRG